MSEGSRGKQEQLIMDSTTQQDNIENDSTQMDMFEYEYDGQYGEDGLSRIITGKSYNAFAHEDESKFPDGGLRAWTVVAGSCIGMMSVFGIMNTISSIEVYLNDYLLKDETVSETSWIFSLYMFCNLGLGIVAGPLFDLYGIKKVLIPGIILNCGGLYATAYSTKLWHFVISFGIVTGVGSGLMMNPLMSVVSHWFLKRRGLANGFAQAGSLAGIPFPFMLRALYPKLGFSTTMVILASICVILCIISYVLVEDRRDVLTDRELIESRTVWENIKSVLDINAFKERPFTLLVCGLFFNEFTILLVITYVGTYAEVRGMPESETYILLAAMNSAGVFGKIVVPWISDKIGRFNDFVVIELIMAIMIFAVWLPYYNTVGLYIFACAYGIGFSGSYSLTATSISQISLTKQFGSRYATAYFVVAFSNLISMPIGTQFINVESVGNYNRMIIFAGCMTVVSLIFLFAARQALVGKRWWKFV